jgi:hypothetical protein
MIRTDDGTASDAPGENVRSRLPLAPLPRLRIHHILVWTAVTALWLTLARLVFDRFRDSAGVQLSMMQFNLLAAAVVYGAATAVSGLGIYWRLRGLAFFTQPGHWVACWLTLGIFWTVSANLLAYWQMQAVVESSAQDWLLWLVFNSWIHFFAVGACLLSLAIWAADTRAWRILFVGWAICRCVPRLLVAVGWGRTLASIGVPWWTVTQQFVPLALLFFAGLSDFRDRHAVHRHWSHWAGILVGASVMSFEVALYVLIWLARP